MKPKSLSLRTDLIFWRRDGRVVDRGDYLVIETARNPGYYWGNLLVFPHPPEAADLEAWPKQFEHEFAEQPGVRHMTLAWDTTTGELGVAADFVERGFKLSSSHVLVLSRPALVQPPHFDGDIRIAALSSDEDWRGVIETQVDIAGAELDEGEFREFLTHRIGDYRAMIAAGEGAWFGAFVGDRLVGDAGIFFDGALGRFQEVETHVDFRRRGVCATLVFTMAAWAFAERGAEELVIVADDNEFRPASVYSGVGFVDREQISGLCRYPDATSPRS